MSRRTIPLVILALLILSLTACTPAEPKQAFPASFAAVNLLKEALQP